MKKFLLSTLVCFAIPSITLAATTEEMLREQDKTIVGRGGDIYGLLNSLLDRLPYIMGALAFFALLYSGGLYVLSFGDPGKMESAKKNLAWTITGIIAITAIYAIISVLISIIGPKGGAKLG